MLRNYLAAALRNLIRNRLYAAISIVGLGVGMAAAILAGLYIRDELTFDHFIPGHENVYVLISRTSLPGRPVQVADGVLPQVSGWMKLDFPEVRASTRMIPTSGLARASVRKGEIEAVEDSAWIDPNYFQVLPAPVVAGDLSRPLAPNSVVFTRSVARKYFGRDGPVGELVELDRTAYRVAGVIEDLPSNSHLNLGVFGYTNNPKLGLAACDARPYQRGNIGFCGRAYLRFASAADAERVRQALPAFVDRHIRPDSGPAKAMWANGVSYSLDMVRLDRLHFSPQTMTRLAAQNRQANVSTLYALGAVAVLILVIAGVNFVNLMTARATRRAVEVGVRKAAGAEQRHLVGQFMGESLIYAALGALSALVLVELLLPSMNAALQRTIVFDYWRDPALGAGIVALTVAMGLLAGIYPALVLSSFRPSAVLKGGAPLTSGSVAVREGLVIVQFAILVGLILATTVISLQTRFAMKDGLRFDTEQVLTVDVKCTRAFAERVKALPGVRAAACSSQIDAALSAEGATLVARPGKPNLTVALSSVDYGFLELYGIRPLAGRLFSPDHPADVMVMPSNPQTPAEQPKSVIVNETAAKALGYARPEQAIGASVKLVDWPVSPTSPQIVGVVPDFSIDLLHGPVKPTAFIDFPGNINSLSIKLDGRNVPETLQALDRLWKQSGQPRAMQRRFLNEFLQTLYVSSIREGLLVGALAAVAVFIGALGLFGLAAFTAERRTKEIGVRKAMGASRTDIVRLLLWQFTRPVLWANLIAWPLAWWMMDRWLHGFASHIALGPGLFVAATVTALLIAWATVLAHALKVARARPVHALRYE